MGLNDLHINRKSFTLANTLIGVALLDKETMSHQCVSQCRALSVDMKVMQTHSGSSARRDAQWGRRRFGGSIVPTFVAISLERLGVG